ncbi:MAG TPA: hypothetical protein VFC74_10645 [Oscillospiraceae bacterium]|nr:hypothetical protein [Oscillospiraceae bacterium]
MNHLEYMVVYRTLQGQQAGIYKEMTQKQLDRLLHKLKQEGCVVNSVEIKRRCFR